MIKDILVNLSVENGDSSAADFALSVAGAFDAHLTAAVFEYELFVPGTIFGGGIAASLIEGQRRERDKVLSDICARFKDQARRANVAIELNRYKATTVGAAEKMESIARFFDLSIFGQPEPDRGPAVTLLIEAALFGSGRPVIIVPKARKRTPKFDRVTLCWDGGRPAARAIADALPFLARSKFAELLIVEVESGKTTELPGADMGHHLARHGLPVEVNRIPAPDNNVGRAILSHAAETATDLLVIGGYGHSRLREFVLGGVTREVLKNMTVPTLMSH